MEINLVRKMSKESNHLWAVLLLILPWYVHFYCCVTNTTNLVTENNSFSFLTVCRLRLSRGVYSVSHKAASSISPDQSLI